MTSMTCPNASETESDQTPRQALRQWRDEHRRMAVALMRDSPVRLADCGKKPRADVGVRFSDGHAGFAGLITCGSVWVCMVCSAKIAAHRAAELTELLLFCRNNLHTLAMATFTVGHRKGNSLKDIWDRISKGWNSVVSGDGWKSESEEAFALRLEKWQLQGEAHDRGDLSPGGRVIRAPRGWDTNTPPKRRIGDKERYGVLGWVRATEVTEGRNGWHVHIHAILVLDGNQESESRAKALHESMFKRWKTGIKAPRDRHGNKKNPKAVDFRAVRDATDIKVNKGAQMALKDYIAKGVGISDEELTELFEVKARGLAKEATLGAFKMGKKRPDGTAAGRSPFTLVERAHKGSLQSHRLWEEWVQGSFGRRQMAWSLELKEMIGLIEIEDSEVAAKEVGTEDDTVAIIPSSSWYRVRHMATKMLDTLENEGVEAFYEYLTEIMPEWSLPVALAPQKPEYLADKQRKQKLVDETQLTHSEKVAQYLLTGHVTGRDGVKDDFTRQKTHKVKFAAQTGRYSRIIEELDTYIPKLIEYGVEIPDSYEEEPLSYELTENSKSFVDLPDRERVRFVQYIKGQKIDASREWLIDFHKDLRNLELTGAWIKLVSYVDSCVRENRVENIDDRILEQWNQGSAATKQPSGKSLDQKLEAYQARVDADPEFGKPLEPKLDLPDDFAESIRSSLEEDYGAPRAPRKIDLSVKSDPFPDVVRAEKERTKQARQRIFEYLDTGQIKGAPDAWMKKFKANIDELSKTDLWQEVQNEYRQERIADQVFDDLERQLSSMTFENEDPSMYELVSDTREFLEEQLKPKRKA